MFPRQTRPQVVVTRKQIPTAQDGRLDTAGGIL